MRLFFTGASSFLGQQTDPSRSLGGLISSSPLPNGSVDEVFDSISEKQMNDGSKETRGFAFLNETGIEIVSPRLFYMNESREPITNIRMSIVEVGQDTRCSTFYIESISNGQQSPINASFKDNRGESNAIVMPNIPAGGYIGIWVERSINTNRSKELMSCENLYARHISEPTNQIQTLDVVADTNDSLNGVHFELITPNGRFYVWYNTGTGTDPNIVGTEGIEVGVLTNDSADIIASKTQTKLQSILNSRGEVDVSVQGSTITISNLSPGSTQPINVVNSGFSTTVTVNGIARELEKEESINIFIKY